LDSAQNEFTVSLRDVAGLMREGGGMAVWVNLRYIHSLSWYGSWNGGVPHYVWVSGAFFNIL